MIELSHLSQQSNHTTMPESYILKNDLDYTLKYWWLIVLLMLIGVTLGWGFSQLNPPLYEAQAEITVSVDISRTGTLTGESQDMLIDNVGDIIGSPAVMDFVNSQLEPPRAQAVYLERKADRFALRVVGRNQEAILDLAERWSELAINELDQASQHAISAEILERYLDSLTDCVGQFPSTGVNAEICSLPSFAEIQASIQEVGAQLQQEKESSLGLIPGIRYWLSRSAQLSTQPVQYHRKYLLLSGAVIGLILGIWLLHNRLPERIKRSAPGD